MKSLILLILLFSASTTFALDSLDLLLEIDKGKPGNDDFGTCVSYAGDLNKDGYDDVIIGYPSNHQGGQFAGSAYVYFGGEQMDAKADLTIIGQTSNGYLGTSVSFAGDANGDGFSDFFVGGRNPGKVFLYFGALSFMIDDVADLIFSDSKLGSNFGNSFTYISDFNNDGFDDFIISANLDNVNGTQAGRAYIYLGGPSLGTIPENIFTGESKFNFFGESVAFAGDVNNDGFSDVIIGAPGYETDGNREGRVYIFFGNNSLDSKPDVVITGLQHQSIGDVIASAGDINDDGYDDIIIGAPYIGAAVGPASYVYIYYGGNNMDAEADIIIKETLFAFGTDISYAGDINNDDYDDIMISDEGNVFFYYGGSTMDTIPDITLKFHSSGEFVQSIAIAGDVNNDGHKDILISTSEPTSDSTRTGRIYIYSGIINSTSINSNLSVTENFILHQNYPNPFNPSTIIKYNLQKSDNVSLKIYNLSGQEIETLVNGFQTSGEHKITWRPTGLPSGLYIYKIQLDDYCETKKLVYLK